jgi:hypothetical protein
MLWPRSTIEADSEALRYQPSCLAGGMSLILRWFRHGECFEEAER